MWRKLKSSKDDTSFIQELKKEFNPQAVSIGNKIKSIFEKHPKEIIKGMMVVVVLSALLSFFVLIPMEKERLKKQFQTSEKLAIDKQNAVDQSQAEPLPGNNINDVIAATHRLKVGLGIKQEVDAILSKPKLTGQDSLRLNTLLDSLKTIRDLNK